MNPKPFWPLNHFTVPVVIFLLQSAYLRIPRDAHAEPIQFVDVSGKGARRRIQQGTAAERTAPSYTSSSSFARLGKIKSAHGSGGTFSGSRQLTMGRQQDMQSLFALYELES